MFGGAWQAGGAGRVCHRSGQSQNRWHGIRVLDCGERTADGRGTRVEQTDKPPAGSQRGWIIREQDDALLVGSRVETAGRIGIPVRKGVSPDNQGRIPRGSLELKRGGGGIAGNINEK